MEYTFAGMHPLEMYTLPRCESWLIADFSSPYTVQSFFFSLASVTGPRTIFTAALDIKSSLKCSVRCEAKIKPTPNFRPSVASTLIGWSMSFLRSLSPKRTFASPRIDQEQFPQDRQEQYRRFIKEYLVPRYVEFIGKEIQTAYLESYSEYGQNIFDRYVTYADFWIQDQEFRDPDTGEIFDRQALNEDLEKIEKPAGISNPKDFRNEVVNFVLRARANNHGKNPSWLSYQKLRDVIEKKMFSNTEDLLPVISFNAKGSEDDQRKHNNFVQRMVSRGYTEKQVRLLSEWYLRVRKAQ